MKIEKKSAFPTPPDREGVGDGPVKRRGKTFLFAAASLVALFAGGVYANFRERTLAATRLAGETKDAAVPVVEVAQPQSLAPSLELALPGQTTAFTDAQIYARASGYLTHWYFDIGARVKKGQLLAQIETPELDQQLKQARADLATAEANAKLANVTAQRNQTLWTSQWVSTQMRDNSNYAYQADVATVASRQAAVGQLEELQSYENVYAPFDGVVTARNTDVGDLINAGAGSPTAELFHMSAIETLRIYVAVPEIYSPAMQVGSAATITADEYPARVFHGVLTRTSGAINPTTRTLQVEVDVDNTDGKLLPGAYVSVHFMLPGRSRSVIVPSNALLFRSEGLRVGVVRNERVELVPITIGRDYGDRVEVLSGLSVSDKVILNPADSLVGGAAVRIANKTAKAG